MAGLPPATLRPALRLAGGWIFSPEASWPQSRRRLALSFLLPLPPRSAQITTVKLGGVPCLEVVPAGADRDRVIVYLHGGGYVVGSPRTHRRLAALLAGAAGARAVLVDYRLAPEHPFPAALEDASAVWRALLAGGLPASRTVLAGDSAGGGLALAVALQARDRGQDQPAALALICPWLDLTPTPRAPAPREPLLSEEVLARFAHAYLNGHDPTDPLVSPVRAELGGLAPLLVQSGGDDLLVDDARRIAIGGRAAGLAVEDRCVPGLWHDFHALAGVVAGADRALEDLGVAIGRHLRG
ncbi:MAG TPA: alpha/beta hydrolase [Solirubrobacteraceae bacterium]|jgi:acetyl esterase/lipase|nr:alpha/beta hydrolase [Solirubrobacteraceae bacterium]